MTSLKLPKTPRKVISTFSQEQIQKVLSAIDRKSSHGFRNYTMILLLLDTGIRLSELIGLQMDDIDFLQSFILAKGKGNKERAVPFGSQVRHTLRRYITHFRPDPIFSYYSGLTRTSRITVLVSWFIKGVGFCLELVSLYGEQVTT